MDEIPEIYNLETIEQVRALHDSLRSRILDALAHRAMTVKQVADLLEEPSGKVHYHVRELERMGLLRLVETRENKGILEKYYRAVAKAMYVPARLYQSLPPNEAASAMNEMLQSVASGFLRAFTSSQPPQLNRRCNMFASNLWLSDEEHDRIMRQIAAIIEPYTGIRKSPDRHERTLAVISYQTPKATGAPTSEANEVSGMEMLGGSVYYSREELESVLAEGRRLDLDVWGYCEFAEDVPAELVDKAIASFRHHGVLVAPPQVREILKGREVAETGS